MFEAHPDNSRIVPLKALGPWARRPIRERLSAADTQRPVILDLTKAPVTSPGHIASILWIDDAAQELGVSLEIFTPDIATAELIDFAGVKAPVFAGAELQAAVNAQPRRASAY